MRGLVGDAIFQDELPSDRKDTLYIVIEYLGAIPGRHLTRVSGYADATLQTNVWGRTPDRTRVEVEAVADAIRETVKDHLAHTTLGTPPNDVSVGSVMLERNPNAVIHPKGGEEGLIYGARQTALIEYTESIPTSV